MPFVAEIGQAIAGNRRKAGWSTNSLFNACSQWPRRSRRQNRLRRIIVALGKRQKTLRVIIAALQNGFSAKGHAMGGSP